MEHIVQFAISIDDQTIQKRIEENAYNDILNKLANEAKTTLPKGPWGKGVDWDRAISDALDAFVEKNRDDIIDAAAEKLYESFKRTKTYKEKMAEAVS